MRAVAEGTVGNPNRPYPHLDPEPPGAGDGGLGPAGDRVGRVRVAVRVSPGPVVPGHRELELEALVVRLEVPVGDRPVLPHSVAGSDLEIGGVKARAIA